MSISNAERNKRVLDAIKKTPCMSKAQIVTATGLSSNDVELALRELQSAICQIEECEIGSETYRVPESRQVNRGKRRW